MSQQQPALHRCLPHNLPQPKLGDEILRRAARYLKRGRIVDGAEKARGLFLKAEVATALRLLTRGSVDDGKSTLIGRLLTEQDLVPEDQLAAAARSSKMHCKTSGDLDVSLLLDGLDAEREQNVD